MSKTFGELNIGDYIFHCSDEHKIAQAYRIEDIDEHYDVWVFHICWFGEFSNSTKSTYVVNVSDLGKSRIEAERIGYYSSEHECSETGPGDYINNSEKDLDKREYELIQENLLFKDMDMEPYSIDGEYAERPEYYWRRKQNLVLYKALYPNPDGPYFVRHAEDFYKNFTRIN